MDIELQFNNTFVDLIQMLRENTSTTNKKLLGKYYKAYDNEYYSKGKLIEYVGKLIKVLSKYGNELSIYDESLFSEDYYKGPLYLLTTDTINFKVIWKELNDKDKKNFLFNKLQFLYVLGMYILKSSTKFAELYAKQKELQKKIAEALKTEQELKHEIARQDLEEQLASDVDYEEIRKKFGDGIITDIIIDIIKEITSNGIDISSLTSIDGEFMSSIHSKLQKKISDNLIKHNMTQDQLFAEAKTYKDKFVGFAKSSGIKMFANLAEKLEEIIEKVSSQQSNTAESELADSSADEIISSASTMMEELKKLLGDMPAGFSGL